MKVHARVALMTNCVPTYRVPLFTALQERVDHLNIFVSLREVPDRDWHLFLDDLHVTVARSFARTKRFQNKHGFADESLLLVPYDTVWQLARYRPNVVVSSEFGMRTIFACIYKMLFPRSRLILWATLSERTEETRGTLRRLLRRLILQRVDGMFVNGRSGERYVRGLGFGSGKPLAYICYTIENGVFEGLPTRSHAGPLRLFFVGQIVERKGLLPFLEQLCQWCSRHPEQPVEFTIAGAGAELERLRQVAAPPSLSLVFPGVARSEELPALYHRADISVFPTLADEWGVVVNEALMAGLPILASCHSQAVEELVTDGINGWIFDSTSQDDIYRAIDRALSCDRAALDSMRQPAMDAVVGLTPQLIAERMATLIQAVQGGAC